MRVATLVAPCAPHFTAGVLPATREPDTEPQQTGQASIFLSEAVAGFPSLLVTRCEVDKIAPSLLAGDASAQKLRRLLVRPDDFEPPRRAGANPLFLLFYCDFHEVAHVQLEPVTSKMPKVLFDRANLNDKGIPRYRLDREAATIKFKQNLLGDITILHDQSYYQRKTACDRWRLPRPFAKQRG